MREQSENPEIKDPNIAIAAELLHAPEEAAAPTDLLQMYAANNTENEINHVEMRTGRDQASILYLSELLIGHKDSAVDFFYDTIDRVKNLPADMKPDVVVMSGLMQGDFKMLEKRRRGTLVPELTSMDAQFKYAKQAIDGLRSIGVPVVYNLSNDDRRIAEDYTVETFRKMFDYAKHQEGINWGKIDKMRQHPKWLEHRQFQIDTVFPYCLRAGRRLRSAQEMSELTDGAVDVEEYFMLLDAHKRQQDGKKPTREQTKWLELDNLTDKDFIVTDDVDLTLATNERKYTNSIRHYLGFSAQPMYQNHMKAPTELLGHMASSGQAVPDALVTQNNQEEIGVSVDNAWAISTGGLLRAGNFLGTRGSGTDVPGDISKRLAVSRRRIPNPSASIHTRSDDGRYTVTFFNDTLNEKSHSIPERMTIAELCDLQTGSITARPDILAKYLDYIRTRAIGERTTALFFGGDMIHGRNYPHFPAESQSTGLMAMDSQVAFNKSLFRSSFKDMSREEMDAIQKVMVQIGNHEWNSGTLKWHGYSFADYMREIFERKYAQVGYNDEEIAERVKFHDAVRTPKGEVAQAYTGIEYFGDMGVLIQHYLQERGGKGSGGSLPIYQAQSYANGAGDLMKNIDVMMAGHWHHPQYGLFGDKLGLVGGSMAGLSGYELWRGYRPTVAGTMIHMGGGQPLQVEFVSEEALHKHKITTGEYMPDRLAVEGYKDDRGFDPARHGIFLPDSFAKSGLQKKILRQMRDASQRAETMAEFR